jgi:hypothetical protein
MYDAGLVGKGTVLLAGDYKISDAPTKEEDLEKFTRELMLRDPNLFQIPAIRKVAGYTDEILPPDTVVTPQQPGQPGAGPPPPPVPPTGISATPGAPIPQETVAQNAPGGPPTGLTASSSLAPLNVFVIANATVLRAMELAGKRLAGNVHRYSFTVPVHEVHTQISVDTPEKAKKLLNGAWDHLGLLAEQVDPTLDTDALRRALDMYCSTLLMKQRPHRVELLKLYLEQSGFLSVPA